MDSWKLRDVLLKAISQWYLILALIVLGALIGFGSSYLAPAPYQAVRDIYLGIDINRVNELEYVIPLAKTEPLNLDDYKNWQLKQAADILASDQVLGSALEKLQNADPAWNDVSLKDFRSAIDIYWYDAGTWRLEVQLPEKALAKAAVEAWAESGYQRLDQLLQVSREGYDLDQSIWTYNIALADLKVQKAQAATFLSSAAEWVSELQTAGGSVQIDSTAYQDLTSWLLPYRTAGDYWDQLLSGMPAEDQTNQVFIDYFNGLAAAVESARGDLERQMAVLQQEKEQILPEYHQMLEGSLGLSPNLVLRADTSTTWVSQVHSTADFTLGGAFLGLAAWAIIIVARIKISRKDDGK